MAIQHSDQPRSVGWDTLGHGGVMMFDAPILTAAAIALCSQLGISPCTDRDLTFKWLDSGGFCGNYGCNWTEGCPNDMEATCHLIHDPAYECFHIYSYATIGSVEKFRQDDTLDGPGGKQYLCRPRVAPTS